MSALKDGEAPDLEGFLRWLEDYRQGDTDPYRAYLDRLTYFFIGRGQGDPEECADLTLHKAAFLYHPSLREAYGNPLKFILGVARNVNYDELRKIQRFVALDERIEVAAPPPFEDEDPEDEHAELPLLREYIRDVGREKLDAVIAYCESLRKGGEPADVKTRVAIHRAIEKMKKWVEKRRRAMPEQT